MTFISDDASDWSRYSVLGPGRPTRQTDNSDDLVQANLAIDGILSNIHTYIINSKFEECINILCAS